MEFKKVTVITGHYGSGKTNISANLALHLARQGCFQSVSIVDLDIVNPYFRVADFSEFFRSNNINLVVSKFANTNLDIPSLGFDLTGVIRNSGYTIIDVGGDDAGALALGRYSDLLNEYETDMFYVINKYRYLTKDTDDALELLREIEYASNLKCTGIINNSNLGSQTTEDDICSSVEYAKKISDNAKVPVVFTCGKSSLNCKKVDFPIEIFVKTIWQNDL